MQYIECPLTDLGFVDGDGNPLASIEGRDNRTQPFRHLGITGYPAGAALCIDRPGQDRTLAILPDGAPLPEGGTEILSSDVVDLLVAEYGWPAGTTLVDGLPMRPRE